jgi:hypothetical protein
MQECLPPDRLPSHGRFRRFRYSYVAEINAGLAIQLSRKSEIVLNTTRKQESEALKAIRGVDSKSGEKGAIGTSL